MPSLAIRLLDYASAKHLGISLYRIVPQFFVRVSGHGLLLYVASILLCAICVELVRGALAPLRIYQTWVWRMKDTSAAASAPPRSARFGAWDTIRIASLPGLFATYASGRGFLHEKQGCGLPLYVSDRSGSALGVQHMCFAGDLSIRQCYFTTVSRSNAGPGASGSGFVARDSWWGNVYGPRRLVDGDR
jgi:hypothetical protein